MEALERAFGADPDSILWWQMSLRTGVVMLYLLVLIRSSPRAFGQNTAFDVAVAILLGSMLSRVITATAPLVPTFVAAAVLIVLHAFLARVTFLSPGLGAVLKGREQQLVRDGKMLPEEMRRANVTEHDLCEALRTSVGIDDLSQIDAAFLERSGRISFVRAGAIAPGQSPARGKGVAR